MLRMETPFILLDTRTGFHVGSRNLKAVHTEANSKSALAVLCSSILLQWRCVVDDESASGVDSSPCCFEVKGTRGHGANGNVLFFHSRDGYLAVVFASVQHDVYARFAELLVDEAAQGRLAALKNVAGLRDCAKGALAAAVRRAMETASIADFAVLGSGAGSRIEIVNGTLKDESHFLLSQLESSMASGMYVSGTLTYTICRREDAVAVVAVPGLTDTSLHLLDRDGVVISWVLSLCSCCDG